jgi:tetratricopeptide (TPR) repeat protein/tRNA A-37 threonylcarbamoyl transferase component Bud32
MNAPIKTAREVFVATLKLAPQQWDTYLDEVCGADDALRRRVRDLLDAHREAGSFLESPAAGPVTPDQAIHEGPGTVVGPYQLLEPLGEGGMGTVFLAQQTQPVQRRVALKVIKPGMDSRQVIARFEAERQALALMDHPNIATVLDGGTTDSGRPFFVMELVKGVPITRYCDEHRLTPRQRLELFVPVCQAVQHAHQKGIIHRDLKPSNVLIARYDDRPVPKVIDFGVAKATGPQLTDQSLHTGFGAVVGTLEYMSPEQAGCNQLDVDTRSDLYSLGVLLYELLAGSPPFSRKELEKAGLLEMLRMIREQEPSKPSTKLSTADGLPTLAANRGTEPKRLAALVRGELDWIVLKALEKDRNRRYQTANGFAMDVQRYLADEPVLACPPSAGYRLRKFVRRNKARLAVVAGVFLAVTVMAASIGWVVRDREARQAEINTEIASALQHAALLHEQGKWPEALAALGRAESLAAQQDAVPDPALRERLRGLKTRLDADQRDRQFAARFDQIRMEQSEVDVDKSEFRDYEAAPKIRAALEEVYQIQFGLTAPGEMAALVRQQPEAIQNQLLTALSMCLMFKEEKGVNDEKGVNTRTWLTAVLEAADTDPWRRQVRAEWAARKWLALEKLAREANVARQPPAFLLLLAWTLSREGGPTHLALLRQVRQTYPGDFWANHTLAFALAYSKPPQLEEAIRYYTAAAALRPESAGVHLNLGNALSAHGHPAEAIAAHREAIRLKPHYPMAHNNLGSALRANRDLEGAIAAYKKALELNPKFAKAHCNLGLALHDKKNLEGASAAYKKAIELDLKDATAHLNLGLALQDKGDLAGAIACYKMALQIDPKYAKAHTNLGLALKAKGELDGAIAAYRKAIELDPRLPQAHYNLGRALYDKRDLAGAIAAFQEALQIDPRYAKAHTGLGTALYAQKDLSGAIVAYRKAIELNPKYVEAHSNLGAVHYRAGHGKDAVAALEESMKLRKGGSPYEWYFLAMAHWKLGDKKKAVAWYDRAVQRMAKNPHPNEILRGLHAEATALLGVKGKKGPAEKK